MLKIKLDANGQVVLNGGNVVYVNDEGKDVVFDANNAFQKIAALNGECKSHREAAEAATAKLKAFEGLDAEGARKALEVVKNLEDKKLVDAGEVETLKKSVAKAFETKIEELNKGFGKQLDDAKAEISKRDSKIFNLMVTNRFGTSDFVGKMLNIPADMAEAAFGKFFKVEDDRVVGYKSDGSKIFSTTRPGELADFEEALGIMVEAYPHKDKILRNTQSGGSGKTGNQTASGSGVDLSGLSPVERLNHARSGGKK